MTVEHHRGFLRGRKARSTQRTRAEKTNSMETTTGTGPNRLILPFLRRPLLGPDDGLILQRKDSSLFGTGHLWRSLLLDRRANLRERDGRQISWSSGSKKMVEGAKDSIKVLQISSFQRGGNRHILQRLEGQLVHLLDRFDADPFIR